MDDTHFDRLARLTATRATRRGARLLVLLGLAAAAPADDGAAAAGKDKKACRKGRKRCGKRCIPTSKCCTSADCPRGSGQTCSNGKCTCRRGQQPCARACIPKAATCCTKNADCAGSDLCANNRCVVGQGTCPTDATICSGTLTLCNDSADCFCIVDASNRTRCGIDLAGSAGVRCDVDADCAGFGPEAFCVAANGDCGLSNCLAPCPIAT